MIVDALVLSGGRGARLGGVSKADLVLEGATLLERTLTALAVVRSIVIVGEAPRQPPGPRVSVAREQPPFGGPVAAIGAGIAALDARREPEPDAVVLLAVDMPHITALVPELLAALTARPAAEAVLALDESSRAQPLAAIYRTVPLRRVLGELASGAELAGEHPAPHPLASLPMRAITARLVVATIPAPLGSTADVDTPADAAALGIDLPAGSRVAPADATTATTTTTDARSPTP